MGMSMGSTGAWWTAALDERVRAVVGVEGIRVLEMKQEVVAWFDRHLR